MTTESDFQAALDVNPEDHQTRMIFADWLQEHDDPRADGYRALGVLRKRAMLCIQANSATPPTPDDTDHIFGIDGTNDEWEGCYLPESWIREMQHTEPPFPPRRSNGPENWVYFKTRREAEDAAALAFARLPPERRAELLNPTVPA